MAQSTANMGLRQWNLVGDYFESTNLSSNWAKVDIHDHTSGKGVQIPTAGLQNQAVDGTKIANLSISTAHLLDDSVTAAKIATDAVGSAEIAAGAVGTPELAAAVLNGYLKLSNVADHKFAFGGPYDDGASWGIAPERTINIPHGLGATPSWGMGIATTAISTASGTDLVVCTLINRTSTNLVFRLRTLLGGNCNLPGVGVYWAAIV